jgi:hypothetical protein
MNPILFFLNLITCLFWGLPAAGGQPLRATVALPATAGRRPGIVDRPAVTQSGATSGHQSLVRTRSATAPARVLQLCTPYPPPPNLLAHKIFRMWSTLPHWLEHMPALPRLLLETWNIHNFWFVGPKNALFFLPAKLIARRMYTKCFKKSKNSVCSSDTDQNRFVRHTDIQSFRG